VGPVGPADPDLDPGGDPGSGDPARTDVKQILTQDGRDLLDELSEAGARFLVVGA
jgi:hypothetical protein